MEQSKNGAKEYCRKDDEAESRRHNYVRVLKSFLVNLEYKTKGNGSSDHTGEPNENLLLEIQFAIEFEDFQEQKQTNYCNESTSHDYKNLNDD